MTFGQTLKKIKSLEIQSSSNVTKQGLKALSQDIQKNKETHKKLLKTIKTKSKQLSQVRVTEPAIRNGLRYLAQDIKNAKTAEETRKTAVKSIRDYLTKMKKAEQKIAEIGSKRIKNNMTVMTHCHSRVVMSILKKAKKQGKKFKVICTETRPFYQGRTTAKELLSTGIPVTMIVDSAARSVMNDVDLVLFGADAITSDGFLINKIGTSQIALAAKEARTMTCTCCETYKFDPMTLSGDWEPIEQRDSKEIWEKSPKKLKILNPAFDATPPDLITFIICEEGVYNIREASQIMKNGR
ncbi:S-methyl-5-thioribose-1-phosphate isomerase [archaeon]|nr:S-methyl-5-thioribose-1-phosphate isomerase [archaeon]